MQIFVTFWLIVVPTAAIFWLARALVPAGEAELSSEYFRVTPLLEIVWRVTLYAFVVSWVTIVVTSLLGCLFIRWTAVSPGLYPSRGLVKVVGGLARLRRAFGDFGASRRRR